MSMLKYDPIGKDAQPPPRRPEETRIGGQQGGQRRRQPGTKRRRREFVPGEHAAENLSEGQSYLASS